MWPFRKQTPRKPAPVSRETQRAIVIYDNLTSLASECLSTGKPQRMQMEFREHCGCPMLLHVIVQKAPVEFHSGNVIPIGSAVNANG